MIKQKVLTPVIAVAAAVIVDGAQAVSGGEDGVFLEPITVTATKRPESDFDIAGSVDVESREQLVEAVVNDTDELDRVFPELLSVGRSSRVYNIMTLRGQASADFFSPSTSFYLDGVPQLPHAFGQTLQEVGQVELLKGPQGAIYGRGALGGVLSITSRRPGTEPELWGNVQGFERGYRVRAGASTGFDRNGLAIQGSMMRADEDGTLDDALNGRDDLDDRENTAGRLSIHYMSENLPLEMRLKARAERYSSHEEYYVPYAPLSRSQVEPVVKTPWLERKIKDVSWDLEYSPNVDWTITGILARQTVDLERTFGPYGVDTVEAQSSNYAELRANYEGAALTAVMGISAQRLRFEYQDVNYGEAAGYMGGPYTENEILNYAVFADTNYRFAEHWEVSLGTRVAREDAEVSMLMPDANGSDVMQTYTNDESFTAVTPRFALAWLPNDQMRLWAAVGRGFKPGGFNKAGTSDADLVSYDSEIATNFEIGLRWRSPGRRYQAEATLYAIDSQDVQGWIGPPGLQILSNMGDATSRGMELQAKMRLAEGQTFTLGGMVNRSRYTSGEFDGKDVAYTPGYSALVAWDGIFGMRDQWRPRIALRATGPHYFDTENDLRQSAYALLEASLMWHSRHGFELGVYGRNLTDELYRVYGNSAVGAQLGAPREIGVQLNVEI
ncbi:TonB-dependent receptor [Thiorhodococcus drewsii]|nr:TonB-dependent receptor [Thiorhodococcus drewsii]